MAPLPRRHSEKSRRKSGKASISDNRNGLRKKFVQMGGPLMAGTHPTDDVRVIPGYADLLVKARFSFPEAVKICSANGARYLGIFDKTGTIERDKTADLVLIDGDPELHISDERKTEIFFKRGVSFDSKKIFHSLQGKVGLY
jgi:imidazolonepropionase-like amidohydrolase